MGRLEAIGHLPGLVPPAHGQKIRKRRAQIVRAIPGLRSRDAAVRLCCGSAGTYNVVQDDMADS